MTIRYEYKCENCEDVYFEQRSKGELMFFPNCNFCKVGKYIEITQTDLEKEKESNDI